MRQPIKNADREQGFVLIAVIWLLVLAGSVVALLMLRGITAAEGARDAGVALRGKLALDAVENIIAAERMFGKPGGRFAYAPADMTVDVDGTPVIVTMTPEDQRLDINVAAPEVLDAALMDAGLDPDVRNHVLNAVGQRRALKLRVESVADMTALLSAAGVNSAGCVAEEFSAVAGTRTESFPAGGQAIAGGPVALRPASAVRINLATREGQKREYIMRLGGQGSFPHVLDRAVPSTDCGGDHNHL